MDEILHAPDGEVLPSRARRMTGAAPERVSDRSFGDRLSGMAKAVLDQAELVRRRASRVFHGIDSMATGKKLWGPVAFLAAAGILGVALVVGTVYTPSYVVTVDGVTLGIVRDPQVFEAAMSRVEARATAILGYDYTIDCEVGYDFALTEKNTLSSVTGFETYLFNQIGEVMKSYVLTVDGQCIGAAVDEAQLDALLERIKAPYTNENTVEAEFVENVRVTREYTASDIMQDLEQMEAILTENTNGETTYAVQKGDTFSAIAHANDMSMDDLEELNPGIDINKLYIGEILTVRETIPFLSVRTVDSVTYTEAIPSPIEEVSDNTMYQGDRKTVVKGTEGEALVSADVAYLNGRETGRTINSTTVLTEATTTVVHVGTKPRPKTMATGSLVWPIRGTITSDFGYRYIFGSYSYHNGLDIAAPNGSPIKAADGGKVIFAGTGTGSCWSYGNYVVIDHENGLQTLYAHCSTLDVKAGDRVYQGQVIAHVGLTGRTTGYHCHFTVKANGVTVSPWNYLP